MLLPRASETLLSTELVPFSFSVSGFLFQIPSILRAFLSEAFLKQKQFLLLSLPAGGGMGKGKGSSRPKVAVETRTADASS